MKHFALPPHPPLQINRKIRKGSKQNHMHARSYQSQRQDENTRWKHPRDSKSFTTPFLDLKTKIVIKLNIVTIAPFCFPRSRPYDSVTKRLHEQNFIFFFVASKNAWRGTLHSKTQTKERKWVSFELLKFILGSAAAGNKTGTRKGIRNLWFHLKASKKRVVLIRTRKNLLLGDLFSENVGGRVPNKKGRRTGWSQAKPEFAKIKVEQKRVNVVLQDL